MNQVNVQSVFVCLAIVLCCQLCGCRSGSMDSANNEAGLAGLRLWYPAEANVTPGEIWWVDGAVKQKKQRKPEKLDYEGGTIRLRKVVEYSVSRLSLAANNDPTTRPATTKAGVLEVAASAVLDPRARLGQLGAALDAAKVTAMEINWGDAAIVKRIVSDDLGDPRIADSFPEGYRERLLDASADPRYQVIDSIVLSNDFTYVLTTADANAFQAVADRIARLVHAEGSFHKVGARQWSWTVKTPEPLVVAYAPLMHVVVPPPVGAAAGNARVGGPAVATINVPQPGPLSGQQSRATDNFSLSSPEGCRLRFDIIGGANSDQIRFDINRDVPFKKDVKLARNLSSGARSGPITANNIYICGLRNATTPFTIHIVAEGTEKK